MKQLTKILICLTFLFSCNSKSTKTETQIEIKKKEILVKEQENIKNIKRDSLTTKEFGQLIIENKIQPSDDESTFKCLEKLVSGDIKELDFYFKVYLTISRKADGAIAEIIGGYIKSLFEVQPMFCLKKYKLMDEKDKAIFNDNLAYEFYASGLDYKKDITDYFKKIEENIEEAEKPLAKSIKENIIKKAKEMNE